MNEIRVLGIDLGKDVCSVVGFDSAGQVLLRRQVSLGVEFSLKVGAENSLAGVLA